MNNETMKAAKEMVAKEAEDSPASSLLSSPVVVVAATPVVTSSVVAAGQLCSIVPLIPCPKQLEMIAFRINFYIIKICTWV